MSAKLQLAKNFPRERQALALEGFFKIMDGVRLEGTSDIRELKILGDWAYLRNFIEIAITPPGGETVRRSGYTLTILRKEADGKWVLARDANLVG